MKFGIDFLKEMFNKDSHPLITVASMELIDNVSEIIRIDSVSPIFLCINVGRKTLKEKNWKHLR